MTVDLPDDTKETLVGILEHAASNERAVIEFQKEDGQLIAADITEHVAALENE